MEPTETELANLRTFKEVGDWIGISEAVGTGVKTAFGIGDTDHVRTLARMPRADYDAVATLVMVNNGTGDFPPTPVQQSQIGMVWEISQFVVGSRKLEVISQREKAADVQAERAHQLALAATGVTHFGGQPQAGAVPVQQQPKAPPTTRMVAYEATVDQSDRKSEVPMMSAADIQKAYEVYNTKLGNGRPGSDPVVPHSDEEPTAEQLTALNAIAVSGAALYAEFGIWKPHANRLKKSILFQGLHIANDGKVAIAEIKGPATYEEWEASWKILRVAAIMLNLLSPAAADGYKDHIRRLFCRYGPMAWLLLYQADGRLRSEHVERIRRRGELIPAKSIGGAACEYDPAMPWEFVYRTGPDDFNFWQREFEVDALLVRAQVDKLGPHIGPDLGALVQGAQATTASAGPPGGGSASSGDVWVPPQQNKGRDKGGGKDRSRSAAERRDANGLYLMNRRGTPLCAAFQSGDCVDITKKGGAPMCVRDSSRIHQCAKCLGAHPANPKDGPACAVPDSNKTLGKGFGKTCGKGRGKWQ